MFKEEFEHCTVCPNILWIELQRERITMKRNAQFLEANANMQFNAFKISLIVFELF